ncbi:unnamed protein product, partial [Timema podura]|nr:unnamed protein product [Timema podura]
MNNQCTSGTSIPDNFQKMKEEIKDELKGFGLQENFQDNSDMFTTSNTIFEYNNDSSEPLSTVPSTFKNESSPSISDQQSINKEKLYCDKKQIIKSHKCDLCGKCFLSNTRLSSHLLLHGEEDYKCNPCIRSYKRKFGTNSHTQTHSEETPLTCRLYGDGMEKKEYLKAHTYTHKPFRCEFCGKACKRKYDLYKHRQTHNEERQLVCELCGKDFKNKITLKSHMSTHSEEKPFKCDICGNGLKRKTSLIKHIQTHSEEKPFECQFCGKVFRCKANFTMHEQSHIERRLLL